LLDTGALVSLLDRSQASHLQCRAAFEHWSGPVVATEAVLTEATHLLARAPGGITKCLDFFLRGGALLVPTTVEALGRVRQLIEEYRDLPMDFADATLVVLAEDLATDLVLTTDRRDFSIYRIRGRRRFRILPD
jgi:predicted nucleic acid-binding protein